MRVNDEDMIADFCQSITGKYFDNISAVLTAGLPVVTFRFVGQDGSAESLEIRQSNPLDEISIHNLGEKVVDCHFTEDGNLLIDFGDSGICVENWKPEVEVAK